MCTAPVAAADAVAAPAAAEEKKKEEAESESDDDMGFGKALYFKYFASSFKYSKQWLFKHVLATEKNSWRYIF